MIGLVLLYFIGNSFYRLAADFNKNKWAFAILGVVTYYASGVVVVFVAALLYGMTDENFTDLPTYAWDLLGIPIGLLGCFLLYRLLKYLWNKPIKNADDRILDADL
jgi:hypothetical protein